MAEKQTYDSFETSVAKYLNGKSKNGNKFVLDNRMALKEFFEGHPRNAYKELLADQYFKFVVGRMK